MPNSDDYHRDDDRARHNANESVWDHDYGWGDPGPPPEWRRHDPEPKKGTHYALAECGDEQLTESNATGC